MSQPLRGKRFSKSFCIVSTFVCLFVAGCMQAIGVQPIKVVGDAMLPTLKDGDRVLFDKRFGELKRGDIVIFYFPQDHSVSYVKRIIGLPGDTVEIREGQVLINGDPIAEPYLDPMKNQAARSLEPVKLSADSYFVAGDNRDASADSRVWGPLQKNLIYGKYTGTYSSNQ